MKITTTTILCLVSLSFCNAQNAKVRWGAFTMGYSKSYVENTTVHSVGGQMIVGIARGSNTMIMSGFLADTSFQKLVVSVPQPEEGVPGAYELAQNYPNPFNPKTVIRSSVPPQAGRDLVSTGGRDGQTPEVSDVRIVVYDVLGREVKVLVNERRTAGRYEDVFDGSGLASGVYYYRITAGKFVQTRAMVLLK